jgi:hypothetical protein
MSTHCRFTLDADDYVVDAINPDNSGKVRGFTEGRKDQQTLRECVLVNSLRELTEKLVINQRLSGHG